MRKISQPKSKKPKILVALMANIRTSNISMLKKANIVEHLNPNIRRLVAPDMDKINKGKIISCTRTFSSSTEILLTFSYPETESLHFGFSAPKNLHFGILASRTKNLHFGTLLEFSNEKLTFSLVTPFCTQVTIFPMNGPVKLDF